jgi:hypothetical protein
MGVAQMTDWFKSTPSRRVPADAPPREPITSSIKSIFSGIFRSKMAERNLNELHEHIEKLDRVFAKENYLAVQAGYYQLAVEAALRIKRPDLLKEFETERDRAILGARSAKPLRPKKAQP